MEKDKVIEIIKACLHKLYTKDEKLLDIKVHEDSLNGRLAGYLRECLENETIKVDTEYDRHIAGLKKYGVEGKSAIVDIVVHERLTDTNNIAAIECKKLKMSMTDMEKIRALIGPEFNYRYGITIVYFERLATIYQILEKKIIEENIEL
jgi:hypothetical protein